MWVSIKCYHSHLTCVFPATVVKTVIIMNRMFVYTSINYLFHSHQKHDWCCWCSLSPFTLPTNEIGTLFLFVHLVSLNRHTLSLYNVRVFITLLCDMCLWSDAPSHFTRWDILYHYLCDITHLPCVFSSYIQRKSVFYHQCAHLMSPTHSFLFLDGLHDSDHFVSLSIDTPSHYAMCELSLSLIYVICV